MDKLLNENKMTEEEFLESYDLKKYDRPSMTVDVVLLSLSDDCMSVLMIKRKNHPFIGQWAVPGGFLDLDEDLETAALRELKEETNVEGINIYQLHTYGDVNRDPRGRVISTAFVSVVDDQKLDIEAADDAEDVRWFDISYEETGELVDIRLACENISASTRLRVRKSTDGMFETLDRSIVSSENMAFDHGLILYDAINFISNRYKSAKT